jgi:hypothetical protein
MSIEAQDLETWLNQGERDRIYLFDLRTRDEFDAGHIAYKYIINIDPYDYAPCMHAKALEDRMSVTGHPASYELFKNRDQLMHVIVYDSDGTFGRDGKRNPRIEPKDFLITMQSDRGADLSIRGLRWLVGGFDAWEAHTQGRKTATSSRPLGAELEALAKKELENDPYSLSHLERQEFENRYPSPEAMEGIEYEIQQPVKYPTIPKVQSINAYDAAAAAAAAAELNAMNQRVPTRPPPVAAKQSYSGVSDRPLTQGQASNGDFDSQVIKRGKEKVGLFNYNNATCYMNSVLQALNATDWLSGYLVNHLDRDPPPPRKPGELSDPPQLLAKNLQAVFRQLWLGKYSFIRPQTLKVRYTETPY